MSSLVLWWRVGWVPFVKCGSPRSCLPTTLSPHQHPLSRTPIYQCDTGRDLGLVSLTTQWCMKCKIYLSLFTLFGHDNTWVISVSFAPPGVRSPCYLHPRVIRTSGVLFAPLGVRSPNYPHLKGVRFKHTMSKYEIYISLPRKAHIELSLKFHLSLDAPVPIYP